MSARSPASPAAAASLPAAQAANSNQSSAAATPNIRGSAVPASTSAAASAAPAKDEAAQQLLGDRQRRRQQLRAANLAIWSQGPSQPSTSLDSNLKKNTAFIKRVKQSLGLDAKEQLTRDLNTLSLDKYREEIVQAVPEGLQKCINPKDCLAAAEILSAFHARFGGDAFSTPLTHILSHALAPPSKLALNSIPHEQRERDEAARIVRQKQLLRVTAELALVELVGHFNDQTSAAWLFQTLKELLSTDKEHANVPILLTLLRALAPALIDPPSGTANHAGTGGGGGADGLAKGVENLSLHDAAADVLDDLVATDPESQPPVSTEMKAKFRKLFETYFAMLSRKIVKEHERLQEQDRRNHEAYIRYGEIFEDRQQSYEKMTRSFEKFNEWGKLLSDLLGVAMPKLAEAAKSSGIGLGVKLDSKSALFNERSDEDFVINQSPWEGEDTKRFYEDLLDLSDIIPPSILSGSAASSSKDQHDAAGYSAEDAAASPDLSRSPRTDADRKDLDVKSSTAAAAAGDLAPEDQMSAGPAAQLNSLLAKLPDLTNRSMIDSAAVDFAFLASKPARRKLVKHFSSIPRSRLDLIPYYARLAATLNRYMPDVGTGLVATLDDEFRYFQRKKNVELTESRAKNARFLGELTKFKVTPSHTIFHCLKVCLEDFSGPNIDVLATLLETCGRYLLRTEESSAKMRSMLEMLRRKRGLVNLDARQLLMLDNAYYQCNPPERKAIEQKVRTPMELFVRHLIYDVLSKKTLDKVLKLLRKLHWEDPETVATLKALFTRVWKMRFSNIQFLAVLVYDLQAYHLAFTVDVIDQVLENIRTGLEQNIFKHNQRRVATVRYLGELYNYRLINSGIVFDQLWSFATFGHPGGCPLPGQVTPIDAPDDYFRIRLICTLLDTCGMCFDRGSLKKKLDEFLVFLNLYVLSKERPLPMEVDFMLSDTLESLRPKFQLKTDFNEAALEVDQMFAAHRASKPASDGGGGEGDDENDYDDEDDESDDDEDESDDDEDDGRSDEGRRGGRKMRNGGDSAGVSQMGDADDDDDDDEEGEEKDEGFSEGGSHLGRETDGEEDEAMLRRREEEATIKREADDEFDRELAKMMAESGSSASVKVTNRGLSDVSIPMIKSRRASQSSAYASRSDRSDRETSGGNVSSNGEHDDHDDGNETQHMRFSLLSKKGNKQTTHEVKVPTTSAIAINTRTKQLKDEAERRQLKELVLAYEGREEEADRRSLEQTLSRRGFKVKFADEKKGL